MTIAYYCYVAKVTLPPTCTELLMHQKPVTNVKPLRLPTCVQALHLPVIRIFRSAPWLARIQAFFVLSLLGRQSF
jgi:hypothetical protein